VPPARGQASPASCRVLARGGPKCGGPLYHRKHGGVQAAGGVELVAVGTDPFSDCSPANWRGLATAWLASDLGGHDRLFGSFQRFDSPMPHLIEILPFLISGRQGAAGKARGPLVGRLRSLTLESRRTTDPRFY